jgi:hypothetical protein
LLEISAMVLLRIDLIVKNPELIRVSFIPLIQVPKKEGLQLKNPLQTQVQQKNNHLLMGALQAQNDLRRIQIEAQQNEAQAIGEQKANIARAEGIKQSNVLQAEGEAQAITIIDEQLRNNPTYLEWLKATKWDGVLPLVTGGAGGQGVTPFIEIPTAGSNVGQEEEEQSAASNNTAAAATPAS